MSLGHDLRGVYVVGSHSIDSLSYESGVSDKDYANLKNIRPVEIVHDGPIANPRRESALSWGVPVLEDFIPNEKNVTLDWETFESDGASYSPVYDRSRIGNRHIWGDKFLLPKSSRGHYDFVCS